MKDFREKVIVITGAGSGIGRELALQLSSRGAYLAINDWNSRTLEDTTQAIQETGGRVISMVFDVGDRTAMEAFADQIRNEWGRVDVVINNAGRALERTLLENISLDIFQQVIDVNLWGVVHGSLIFLPDLLDRPEAALVNVSSVFGLMAYPTQGPYVVSKFAVRGFTETLRIELAGTRVHVACVHPGGIRTNIIHNIPDVRDERHAQFIRSFERDARTSAAEAAATIIRGIERRRKRILIGNDAKVMDFFTRILPAGYEKVLLRMVKPERFRASNTK